MPSWLIAGLVGVAVLAIYFTTDNGQRMVGRLGLELPFGKGPARADRLYLLRACNGDSAAVEQLLANERSRFPDLGEVEIYRRAIRTHMNANPPDLEL